MVTKSLSVGTVHSRLPADLGRALLASRKVVATWEDITPLARNEFICWVENAKANETRVRRVKRAVEDLAKGKRRPCCWMGCIHRTDKAVSPSVKGILGRK